jgi:tripartite-type tricarboxylate transporter receptor subunit TctC
MRARNPRRHDLKTHILRPAVVGVLFALGPAAAWAQADYPSRAVKIVVPQPPGAMADTLPRLLADKLTARWGQPVIIENKPGAALHLGSEAVARAEPDGHTLLAAPQGPLVVSQSLYAKLGYDPNAFVAVTVLAQLSYLLVANPKVPVSSLPELIAYAKANPDKLNYASPGIGSAPHLAVEWLKMLAGIRITHVPYRGAAFAMTDLLAGHVDLMFDNVGNSVQHIKDGKLKALATADGARLAEFPDVPAGAELFSGFVATSWFAIVAPPKTPPAIAENLSQTIGQVLRTPDVAKRLRDLSATPVGGSPAETAAFLKEETARWRTVIVGAGIKPE